LPRNSPQLLLNKLIDHYLDSKSMVHNFARDKNDKAEKALHRLKYKSKRVAMLGIASVI